MYRWEAMMVWWIAAGMLYVVLLAVLCLFFQGAAMLNERFEPAETDLEKILVTGYRILT